jgi:DNA-binding GntR family transcriptional regulator
MATTTHDLDPILRNGEAPSLADRAYVRLREEIISAEVAPGTLLREEELTARLGLGRTPVREAIQRLRREGYVTILPRRGTLVSEISITDLAAIYEVRTRLESWGARLAAERAGTADRSEAEQLIADLEAVGAEDYAALLQTDRRIHRFTYRCAKNPFLAETLDHYHNLSLRILHVAMRRYPALTPRLDDVVHDQRLLLEAIGRADGDAAERVAATHISTFQRAIRELI